MRILYGVQGTGNGHVSRCRSLANALGRYDVEVDYLLSGRDPDAYFDMQAFGAYRTMPGLSFASHHGRVDIWQTLGQSQPIRLVQDIRTLALEDYDLVVSDFEPITAWAARCQGVAALGISHQASFFYPVPRKNEDWAARLLMRHYAPVSRAIGLHWFHFGQPILPPIIDRIERQPEDGSILVYLPFEALDEMTAVLSRFTAETFVCFHPAVVETERRGNLVLHPPARARFTDALSRCCGVISNGGFELASEALTLGKKLLIKPLHGQFEQESNALTLEILGLGQIMGQLDPAAVRSWLAQRSAGVVSYPDVADELARWLASGQEEPVERLRNRLWRQVQFPELACDRILELGFEAPHGCGQLLRA